MKTTAGSHNVKKQEQKGLSKLPLSGDWKTQRYHQFGDSGPLLRHFQSLHVARELQIPPG